MTVGGIPVRCLLDSGSQVSTITESFFNQHFCPRGTDLLDTKKWLTLTAARITGRDHIRIPAGSITTVNATGYRGLLPGEESGILVEPLRDQTHHGLIIASTLTSVRGKNLKLQVANVGQEDVWLRP